MHCFGVLGSKSHLFFTAAPFMEEPNDVNEMALALRAKMTFIYHPMLMALRRAGHTASHEGCGLFSA